MSRAPVNPLEYGRDAAGTTKQVVTPIRRRTEHNVRGSQPFECRMNDFERERGAIRPQDDDTLAPVMELSSEEGLHAAAEVAVALGLEEKSSRRNCGKIPFLFGRSVNDHAPRRISREA